METVFLALHPDQVRAVGAALIVVAFTAGWGMFAWSR